MYKFIKALIFFSFVFLLFSFFSKNAKALVCRDRVETSCSSTCSCDGLKYCVSRTCYYDANIFNQCVLVNCSSWSGYYTGCTPPCTCTGCPSACANTCSGLPCGSDGCGNACTGTKCCTEYDECEMKSVCQRTCTTLTCGTDSCGDTCYGYKDCGPTSCSTSSQCNQTTSCDPAKSNCNVNICSNGTCSWQSCGDQYGEGDTCIQLINSSTCLCTAEGDLDDRYTSNSCIPYRDPQIYDGVCYQQWECCVIGEDRFGNVTRTDCVYQIRQTCIDLGDPTPAPTGAASCTVNMNPVADNIEPGSTIGIEAVVSASNGTVDRVDFSSTETGFANVSPDSDSSSLYQTEAIGVSVGDTVVVANVYMDGVLTCTGNSYITVRDPGAWWQVKDADVTSGGQIYSYIPMACSLPVCNPYFGLEGDGGYPGVPVSFGDPFFGEGDASEVGWVANSGSALRKGYSYSLFERQIPSTAETTTVPVGGNLSELLASGGVESSGAYWFMYDGGEGGLDLELGEDLNLGERKVVLFVNNADLMIKGNISLTNGSGFLMVIVGQNEDGEKGNIYFDTTIGGIADDTPEIEGLFFADNQIYTGETNSQLHIRGVIAGIEGINLQRDLDDDSSTPAEFIEYAPDLILNIPPSLKISKFSWKEVAP